MADELPPALPQGADNGDRAYYRRRIDELMDGRLRNIETAINSLDVRADAADGKLNRIFGALAVLVVLVNLIAPVIFHWIVGA